MTTPIPDILIPAPPERGPRFQLIVLKGVVANLLAEEKPK